MFAVRGRHSQSSERETEERLLGTAAGVSVMLCLLSDCAPCVCNRWCVCVCECVAYAAEQTEAEDGNPSSAIPEC